MFVKMSASGANLYLSCQRKYWHKRINKTPNDRDYTEPTYFAFGAAHAELQELFCKDPMTCQAIMSVCARHGLDVNKSAQMMAVLRKYYSSFRTGKVLEKEKWLEHDVLVGKIDKLMLIDGKRLIVEDKTAHEINPAIYEVLKTDTQLCLYSACREQFEADGILYRVVSKPKERRKKAETWQEYTQRCTCEALEIEFSFDDLDVQGCLDRLEVVRKEVEGKETPELFACNYQACMHNYSPCQYYSQCHSKTYTEINGEW